MNTDAHTDNRGTTMMLNVDDTALVIADGTITYGGRILGSLYKVDRTYRVKSVGGYGFAANTLDEVIEMLLVCETLGI